jgi:methionine synthase II (cobalamin-independent)
MLNSKELDEPYDKAAFAARVKRAIDEIVRKQAAIGLDVIGSGMAARLARSVVWTFGARPARPSS